jgi:hypothetical protein
MTTISLRKDERNKKHVQKYCEETSLKEITSNIEKYMRKI